MIIILIRRQRRVIKTRLIWEESVIKISERN
jgi:hypothetical protein